MRLCQHVGRGHIDSACLAKNSSNHFFLGILLLLTCWKFCQITFSSLHSIFWFFMEIFRQISSAEFWWRRGWKVQVNVETLLSRKFGFRCVTQYQNWFHVKSNYSRSCLYCGYSFLSFLSSKTLLALWFCRLRLKQEVTLPAARLQCKFDFT